MEENQILHSQLISASTLNIMNFIRLWYRTTIYDILRELKFCIWSNIIWHWGKMKKMGLVSNCAVPNFSWRQELKQMWGHGQWVVGYHVHVEGLPFSIVSHKLLVVCWIATFPWLPIAFFFSFGFWILKRKILALNIEFLINHNLTCV